MKKYFKSRSEAIKVCRERNGKLNDPTYYGVFRMPKGSRHVGQFAVCTHMEYLNSD